MSNIKMIVIETQLLKLIALEQQIFVEADTKACIIIGLSTIYKVDPDTIYEMYNELNKIYV